MSRAERLAQKLKYDIDSPTARQVLNSIDDPVETFIGRYRRGSIYRELPGEVRGMTVGEAIESSKKAAKLLIDKRFAK